MQVKNFQGKMYDKPVIKVKFDEILSTFKELNVYSRLIHFLMAWDFSPFCLSFLENDFIPLYIGG